MLFCSCSSGLGTQVGLALKFVAALRNRYGFSRHPATLLSKPIATWGNNHWTQGTLLAMLTILLRKPCCSSYLSVFSVWINNMKRFALKGEKSS